jgi:hypothetical protein
MLVGAAHEKTVRRRGAAHEKTVRRRGAVIMTENISRLQ